MRFVPSPASFGALDPDAVSATAQLLAAATGAGVTIGQEVRAARARKRRRKRRKLPPAPTPLAPQQIQTETEDPETPDWLLPVVLVGAVGLLAYAYQKSKQEG